MHRGQWMLRQVNQNGETGKPPFPEDPQALVAREAICEQSDGGTQAGGQPAWKLKKYTPGRLKISTTSSFAHAICENCRIRLVEAPRLNRGTSKRLSKQPRAPRAKVESAPLRYQTPGALRNPRPTAKRSTIPGL